MSPTLSSDYSLAAMNSWTEQYGGTLPECTYYQCQFD